jgi:cytosine permease
MHAWLRALTRLVEHSPFKPVGQDDQRGWFFLATIKVGVMICVPLFALGGELGTHMRLSELLPAVLCGALATALLATLTGWVGMHARVPTAVLVRSTFGSTGGQVVAAILLLTLFGWFGVQTEVLVHSINTLLRSSFGFGMDRLLLTVLCGALISSTAIIGFRALGKIAYGAVPLLLAVIAVPTWIALSTHDWAPLWQAAPAAEAYGFGMVVSIITGGHMVAVAITPDISRFMRSGRDNAVGMLVGYGLVLPVLLMLAALLASIYRNGDLVAIMVATGVGGPALLVIVLATWTANDKNLYESSLSLSSLLPRVPRWQLTVLAAAIGTGLAAAGIFSHFIALLVFMGITIAPVAGVYLVDYVLQPQRYRAGGEQRLRVLPFVAWLAGIAVGCMTLPRPSGGLGWFALTSAPTVDALLAAAAAQWLLSQGTRRGAAARGYQSS